MKKELKSTISIDEMSENEVRLYANDLREALKVSTELMFNIGNLNIEDINELEELCLDNAIKNIWLIEDNLKV